MKKKSRIILIFGGAALVIALFLATPLLYMSNVFATGQATCPNTSPWVKVDGLSGFSFNYNAPAGYLVAATCYKAATHVIYNNIQPPKPSATVTSTVGHELSHASFKLVKVPTSTATEVPPTPTFTPTFTPTDVPPTPTFTPTFTPTDVPPTPTFTPTSTPTYTPTATETPPVEGPSTLELLGICSGSLEIQIASTTISWEVVNKNAFAIDFTWTANNGENGAGTAPANGSAFFMTDATGFDVSLSYTLENEILEAASSVEPCEEEQPTEEPTENPTRQPTTVVTEDPTEEPKVVVDPQPDQPAGGSGPSIITSLAPIALGLLGIAGTTSVITQIRKKNILNK